MIGKALDEQRCMTLQEIEDTLELLVMRMINHRPISAQEQGEIGAILVTLKGYLSVHALGIYKELYEDPPKP